jgi:L-gulonolactone oxidase
MNGSDRWRTWGHTKECRPATIEICSSVLELAEELERARAAGQTVKVVGSGHSFTDIACTDGRLIEVAGLDRVLDVDPDACTATVEAGISIKQLNLELGLRGLALPNMGDIDRQTLAGAVSTGTHGTGATFGGLATFIRGMELLTADGETLWCSPDEEPEVFACARVGLGALGIVTKIALECVPAFNLHHVERKRRLPDVLAELDAMVDANEHFEFYWLPHTETCATITNNRTAEPARPKSAYKTWRAEVFYPNFVFGAFVAAGRAFPAKVPRLAEIMASTVGAAELIGRSDAVFVSTRILRFAEMEYSIPREHATAAVLAVSELIDEGDHRVSFPIEVRFVAADDIPLSMAGARDSCFVAVHMAAGVDYEPYFRGVEAIMDDFGGRPHWGKLHFQTAETLAPRYPEFDRFLAVRDRLDPDRRFTNAYLDRVLGPA